MNKLLNLVFDYNTAEDRCILVTINVADVSGNHCWFDADNPAVIGAIQRALTSAMTDIEDDFTERTDQSIGVYGQDFERSFGAGIFEPDQPIDVVGEQLDLKDLFDKRSKKESLDDYVYSMGESTEGEG